jgi:hypothetical protein
VLIMSMNPTLAELAALQGDRELTLPKPLSEAALAEVTEAMRLLTTAARRIDAAEGALSHCRVPFDAKPFRRVQDCLNDAFGSLCKIPLANAEAVARQGRRS